MPFPLKSSVNMPPKCTSGLDQTGLLLRHMKLSGVAVKREDLDAIFGIPDGWFAKYMFDETGEPTDRFELRVPRKRPLLFSGEFADLASGDTLGIVRAEMHEVEVTLQTMGATIDFKLQWRARDGQRGDIDDFLGKPCALEASIDDGGQRDMFTKQAAQEKKAEDTTKDILANLGKGGKGGKGQRPQDGTH